jgi:hypothetical protein
MRLEPAVQRVRVCRMPNFLSELTKGEQARLLEELNYMNLEEIRGFCPGTGSPSRSWRSTRTAMSGLLRIRIENQSCWRVSAVT